MKTVKPSAVPPLIEHANGMQRELKFYRAQRAIIKLQQDLQLFSDHLFHEPEIRFLGLGSDGEFNLGDFFDFIVFGRDGDQNAFLRQQWSHTDAVIFRILMRAGNGPAHGIDIYLSGCHGNGLIR
jgi:hypothetical protein